MTVIVNNCAVHYSVVGKGPVVLALHGWGDTHKTFAALVSALKKDYSVVTLDLPGFGATDRPTEPFDLMKYAQFVAAFVEKIDIKKIHTIVGHSNGGAIAIKALSSGVLSADSLVLLASSGVRSTYRGRKVATRLAVKTAKLPTLLLPKSMQTKLKKRVYEKIGSDMFVAEGMQETFKKVVSEDIVHESAMVSCPTLLIYGSLDKATPAAFGRVFASQIEHAEFQLVEGADHFLHHSHAEQVNKLVKDFIDRI